MSDSERQDRMVDWLLGELDGSASADLQRASADDAATAQDAAELRCLFADLRTLTVEPTERVAVHVRHSVERRLTLRRGRPGFQPHETIVAALKIAAVAAVTLGALMIGQRWWQGAERAERVGSVAAADAVRMPAAQSESRPVVPAVDATDRAQTQRSASAWLTATNELASLRREFKSRFDKGLRQRALRAAGLRDTLEVRIDNLADDIARKIDAQLTADRASVQDVSMALRALLASGSTKRMGTHRGMVTRCSGHLESPITALEGGELATALAGLIDVATLYGGPMARLVEREAGRMTQGIIAPVQDDGSRRIRPQLLSWTTPVAQLADAGQVLRVAPAFGVDGAAAARARSYVSEHLGERIEHTRDERPDLLAAHLYGFGELVDRASLENKLRLWRAGDLVPDYFVALHHVSWSRFPLRSGWADFQRELRGVSAQQTPDSATDASALLLCLAVNYAAPGCQEFLDYLVGMR